MTRPDRRFDFWWTAGWVLVGLQVVVALVATHFEYGVAFRERPILLLTTILMAGGIFYFVIAMRALRDPPLLRVVLIFAFLARLPLLIAPPIQEDDIYRYIWDGRVSLHGLDPYEFSPEEIQGYEVGTFDAPDGDAVSRLSQLVAVSRSSPAMSEVLRRVNNPEYATIYPPVTQWVFRAHAVLVPPDFGVHAQVVWMKVVLGLFDALVLLGLLALLRFCSLPLGACVLYAWCPLVLKELANSGHMDAVPTFFMLLALCAQVRRRGALFGVLLGLAVAAKVYALVLLPLALRTLGWRRGAVAFVVAVLTVGLVRAISPDGGGRRLVTLIDFLLHWENHDAVFYWLCGIWQAALGAGEWSFDLLDARFTVRTAHLATLATASVILAGVCIAIARRLRQDSAPCDIVRAAFGMLVAVFLLGPLGFPWYFVWCVPLLPFVRLRSWFLLPAFLPMYYLRFWFDYHHSDAFAGHESGVDFFDDVVVAVEFGVFYAFLFVEGWRARLSTR